MSTHKFKVGDKVIIRNDPFLSGKNSSSGLYFNPDMKKYFCKSGTITWRDPAKTEYNVKEFGEWCWDEKWLEPAFIDWKTRLGD